MGSAEWERARERTGYHADRAKIKQAEATVKQAEATSQIAQEHAKQTEIMRQTEALKQEQLKKQLELENQVSNLKSVVADIAMKISEVELADGKEKLIKFAEVDQELNDNLHFYKAGLVNTGQTTAIEELLDYVKKLKNIRKSIESDSAAANYLAFVENAKKRQELIDTKEKLEQNISELDSLTDKNNNLKKIFSEKYCSINAINDEQFKQLETENKINFSKPGFFILLVRKILFASLILFIAFGLFGTMSSDSMSEGQTTGIFILIIGSLLIGLAAFLTGRKTLKKRLAITQLEKDYEQVKENEESQKLALERLDRSREELKSVDLDIDKTSEELNRLEKNGLSFGD